MRITVNRIVFAVAAVLATLYAGAKHGGATVTFPYTDPAQRYLFDDGSTFGDGFASIRFTALPLLPGDAEIRVDSRPHGSEDEWINRVTTTLAEFAQPTIIEFAGVTTNDLVVYTTWTPGPSVHTNGVAVVEWQLPTDGATDRAAMVRTGVYADGARIAPNPAITNGWGGATLRLGNGEGNE